MPNVFNHIVPADALKPTKTYDQPFFISSLLLNACIRWGTEQSEFPLLGELWGGPATRVRKALLKDNPEPCQIKGVVFTEKGVRYTAIQGESLVGAVILSNELVWKWRWRPGSIWRLERRTDTIR